MQPYEFPAWPSPWRWPPRRRSGATWYPGYYTAALPGITSYIPASPQAWSLLSNGTVIGDSQDIQIGSVNGMPPTFPYTEAVSWTVNGSTATMNDIGPVIGVGAGISDYVYGDDYGRYAAQFGASVYLWNGSAFVKSSNSNLAEGAWLYGETENGLLFGTPNSGVAWAYDLNTSTFYSYGPSGTFPNGGNASGYIVGQDGSSSKGFIWSEATQSYNLIPSLFTANGISNNSQLVAGQTGSNSSGQAAVYNTAAGTTTTYWNGEATYVNNAGTVVGDTSVDWTLNGRALAEIKGQQVDLSTAYAPSGVTFNYCAGLNDAGQILVWANGSFSAINGGMTSYLLTPAMPGDANLDGKVDINDLTVVLANYNQTGMTWSQGEFTGHGTVDINDLTVVLANYNTSLGSSAGAMAAVPEPASAVLLACCGLAALFGVVRQRCR